MQTPVGILSHQMAYDLFSLAAWVRLGNRNLLLPRLLLVLLAFCPSAFAADSRPIVGAIRWDAWTGGEITEQVERTLGPAGYHVRLPWFARVVGKDEVRIDGSPQSVMDREIGFASNAGLDYWAFLLYPQSNSMSMALRQYLQSPLRARIRFCVILHNNLTVGPKDWPGERDRVVALLKEPGYQTVLDGRPLVFMFGVGEGAGFPAGRIGEIRQSAKAAGLNPYFVYMGWNPPEDFARHAQQGIDAVSAYAQPSDQPTYEKMAKSLELGPWRRALDGKVPYVPLVTTGWDKRPRKDHPVSWEKDAAYLRQAVFPTQPTPKEIATHLSNALTFVKEHPDRCPANAIIVYAWNEHDEGGWLSPTWGPEKPDTSRLDAVREVLRGK